MRQALALLFTLVGAWIPAGAHSNESVDVQETALRHSFDWEDFGGLHRYTFRCLALKARDTAVDRDPSVELLARFARDRIPVAAMSQCEKDRSLRREAESRNGILIWITEPIFPAEHEAEVRLGSYDWSRSNRAGYSIYLKRENGRWRYNGRRVNYPQRIAR